MAKKSERLTVVLELAERHVDEVAEEFKASQTQLEQETQKLEVLDNYYREYEVSFEANSRGLSGEDISRQRYFLAQLADAKSKQKEAIIQCETIVAQRQIVWHKAYLKHRALSDLVERIRGDESRALNLKEEKLLDEWSQQAFLRSSAYQ